MNSEKKGYRSALDVKREALTKIAKAWLADGARVLVGAAIALALIFVVSFLQGCGGKSGGSAPVHDDAGVCVANCSNECPSCGYFEYIDGKQICMLNNCVNNGDGWVWADGHARYYGDSLPTYADGKLIPQPDTEPYVCPVKEPPEVCMPKEALDGECGNVGDGPKCYHGFMAGKPCSSEEECKKVPPDAWPPCVCWEFCGFLGSWEQFCCPGMWTTSTMSITLEDDGKGNCRLGEYIGKPGSATINYATGDDYSELYFGDYCEVPSKGLTSCSADGKCLKENENYCTSGVCNPVHNDACYSNEDCYTNPSYPVCQNRWCSFTGESCNIIAASDPDPCAAVDLPCLSDSDHLIEKWCSQGQCSESVWKRQNE